jgi:hypothetical protein
MIVILVFFVHVQKNVVLNHKLNKNESVMKIDNKINHLIINYSITKKLILIYSSYVVSSLTEIAMISSTRALKFGSFFVDLNVDHLYTSNKFTSVDKIIWNYCYYLLSDGDIYYNNTIDNDNFTLVITDGTKFINIVKTLLFPNIIGLSTDSKLYSIRDQNIKCITDSTFCDSVQNIYSPLTYHFIIKKQQLYCVNDILNFSSRHSVNTSFGNIFESVYFIQNELIVIRDNQPMQCNRELSNFKKINIDINVLRMIPEGSFLMFFNDSNAFNAHPILNINNILCCSVISGKNFYVCYKTGKVYCSDKHAAVVIIPELQNCSSGTHTKISSRVKNARFI